MQALSVVIVCRNEAHIIGRTIDAAKKVAAEVLVYDNGSTDDTVVIAKGLGATVIQGPWLGYGKTKQQAVKAASHHWILALDADEVLNEKLQASILSLPLSNENEVYCLRFRNFLGNNAFHWGEFGFSAHVRLFNRQKVQWDNASVHEKLVLPPDVSIQNLKGHILHYTMKDTQEFVTKTVNYALINAEQYFEKGRKATWIKQYVAPAATFIKYYFFRLGLLDGWQGLFAAKMASLYTYVKYARLKELIAKRPQ